MAPAHVGGSVAGEVGGSPNGVMMNDSGGDGSVASISNGSGVFGEGGGGGGGGGGTQGYGSSGVVGGQWSPWSSLEMVVGAPALFLDGLVVMGGCHKFSHGQTFRNVGEIRAHSSRTFTTRFTLL